LGKPLRNWWDVHGEFDHVIGGDRTLYRSPATAEPTLLTDTPP
jgi:hypothetical protein